MRNQHVYIVSSDFRFATDFSEKIKIFFLEIKRLSLITGYSWATNQYLADLFNVSTRTVQYWIKDLRKNKLIKVYHRKNRRLISPKEFKSNKSNKSKKPSYFVTIPQNVFNSLGLTAAEKLLYGDIAAMTHKDGFCWASNKYLANLYNVSVRTIQRRIKKLCERGYIQFVNTHKIRRIFLTTVDGCKKCINLIFSTMSRRKKCHPNNNIINDNTYRSSFYNQIVVKTAKYFVDKLKL